MIAGPAPIHPGTFPLDPSFPQLAVACDAARMREVFRTHLKPVPGASVRIVECAPFRFRCRQATARCVLQYKLRLEEPLTGRQRDLFATGLIYAEPGEAERLWRSLAAEHPAPEIPAPWRTFEPLAFVPELDMVVEIFPYDRRLPQLASVIDGAPRELERLLLDRLGPGRWQAADSALEPTRYRTEMGAVLRYSLPVCEAGTARSETVRCYVKVYRNDRGHETFERLRSWKRDARHGYDLVRPIAYWSELRTLVLEEARGTPLRELLHGDGQAVAAVRAAASATASFNQDHVELTRAHTLAEQIDQLKRASALLDWACPHARAEVRAITAAVVAGLHDVTPAPIHGDLKPDHVFITDGRPVFVDLDSAVLADPVRDPAHFCSYLLARVGLDYLSAARARALAGEFVESYFSRVPREWRRRFELHCAGALVEVASAIFRHQRPGWPERATLAIEEGGYALAGGLR